jgi:hypothetical protein
MERGLLFGTIATFAATITSMILIEYNTNPILLILLPLWGLVMGIAVSRVVDLKKK